ncbi:hypothetical protein PHET_09134 [Paragonimus heterotremus]|uniref:BZIP domain-containing protein n=1 Tax=Paragonimus heterotremus TaxID=100268 RepID=A0A8J4SGX0_9TREM|nr:hypothetical protein PHET_09134 [Paragonimus heterotremus]
MDTIAYQVFGVSFCGAPTQGPKGVEFLWDDADKNSGCTPRSASSVVSLDGLLSESVTFTNSYLESDSGVDDGLDVPLEVVDLFVDYANSPSSLCSTPVSHCTDESCPCLSEFQTHLHRGHSAGMSELPKKFAAPDNHKTLRKKEVNREASLRYRRRLKARSLQLKCDLDAAMASYRGARLAYEKAEQTFCVVQNLLLRLLAS